MIKLQEIVTLVLLGVVTLLQVKFSTAAIQTVVFTPDEVTAATKCFDTQTEKLDGGKLKAIETCWRQDASAAPTPAECIKKLNLRADYQKIVDEIAKLQISTPAKFDTLKKKVDTLKKMVDDHEKLWVWENNAKSSFTILKDGNHLEFCKLGTEGKPVGIVLGTGSHGGTGARLVMLLVANRCPVHVVRLPRYKIELLKGEDDDLCEDQFKELETFQKANPQFLTIEKLQSASAAITAVNNDVQAYSELLKGTYERVKKAHPEVTDFLDQVKLLRQETTINPQEEKIIKKLLIHSLDEEKVFRVALNTLNWNANRFSKIVVSYVGAGYEDKKEIIRMIHIRYLVAEALVDWLTRLQDDKISIIHLDLPFNTTTERGVVHVTKDGTQVSSRSKAINPNVIILFTHLRGSVMSIDKRPGKSPFYQLGSAKGAMYLTMLTHPEKVASMASCFEEALKKRVWARKNSMKQLYDDFIKAMKKKEEENGPKYLELNLPGGVVDSDDYAMPIVVDSPGTKETSFQELLKVLETLKS